MGIGPFSSYAPPGVFSRTLTDPIIGQLLGGLRIPTLIGIGQENLTQTDFEIIRGSSSVADTPIFGEDPTGRWVASGPNNNPVLQNLPDGTVTKFRVRNFPIVDGNGQGKLTFDVSKVSVSVNGAQTVVAAVDGPNGIITLLVPPASTDVITANYFFHRKDTRVTDVVSAQVTNTSALLVGAKVEPYNVILGVNDSFVVTVNDTTQATIKLTAGAARLANDVVNDINSAAVAGLTANVHVDANGQNHVQINAPGNVLVGSGNANGAIGYNVGDYSNRNKVFKVFNGPIVDGSDGGVTTTNVTKVTVLVNGLQVIPVALDGLGQKVTLAAAPNVGSTVSISYFFNTFQDNFDYLPNNNIISVVRAGISPGRNDFLNGPDFVVINQGDQSTVMWGTSFNVTPGLTTGSVPFSQNQITGLLVDNRIFGVPLARFVDPSTAQTSQTVFTLPISPRTGNGRDTPLSLSSFLQITAGRQDLPTSQPGLITVRVGKNFRDAQARVAATVLAVDPVLNTVTLRDPVPADYQVFATYWYNRISDDVFTLNVVTTGPSGIGQYSVTSQNSGPLLGVKFGSKTGMASIIQWPSGSETIPDAFLTGAGTPVAETVTVSFTNALQPAQNASFSNARQEPYDIYTASRQFGGVVIDGNAPVTVDLSVPYVAQMVGQPISNPLSFATTDVLALNVDGVLIAPVALSGLTTLAAVVSAVNAAIDADSQVHTDGSATFAATAANGLASSTAFGGGNLLMQIKGRNLQSLSNGLTSNVTVVTPSGAGQTDGSAKLGLTVNAPSLGSYNALDQVATLYGSLVAPYNITQNVNDNLQVTVDGLDVTATLPAGPAVLLDDVVTAINDAYVTVASAADITTWTADVVTHANAFKTAYNAHIASTVYHTAADATNVVTLTNATDLPSAILLLNQEQTKFNAHLTQAGVHLINDTFNAVTAPAATNLQTAITLAHALRNGMNAHRVQMGIHGHDDLTNTVVAANATDLASCLVLANAEKTALNAHFILAGVHLVNDVTNTIAAANAVDLPTTITLANQLKTNFNAHLIQTGIHVVNDTTNTVLAANAADLPTSITLLNALKVAINAHLLQLQGTFHVHGTNDIVNVVTAQLSELVAHTGKGQYAGKLFLTSRINTANSLVTVKLTGTAQSILGFIPGVSAGRTQPTASALAQALQSVSGFNVLAAAYRVFTAGLGGFLKIMSRTVGAFSSVAFTAVANSALITDTGLGIVPGTSSAIGEAAQEGFNVTSSQGLLGSHGTGVPGQTYTDVTTGLRFSVLAQATGDYTEGGSFTLIVSPTFTCDGSIPIRVIPGVELTTTNTTNMNPGTTALVNTFHRSGNEPKIGDPYYISYQFQKSDLTTALFRDLKRIQANFGTPTPDNPLALGARLAQLNGAVLLALKQVLRTPGTQQASVGSFQNAIDEQRKPISGNIKQDVICPLGTDPSIFAYVNQHCIFMSSPRQQGERIGIVGPAAGTNPLGVQSIAKGLASELMIVTYPDSYVIGVQDDQGNIVNRLIDASFMAAALAGSTCNPAIDVATPITRRSIFGFTSLGRNLDPTEANQTAVAGVTVIEQVSSNLRVRHGLTTRVDTVITRTPSVTLTIQYVQQVMRKVLDPYIGQKFTGSLLKSVESAMVGVFSTLMDQQIVAKVAGINASVDANDPTIMRAEAIYVPIFPLEYIVNSMQIRIRL